MGKHDLYHVIFSGRFVEGQDDAQVLQNLTKIFKVDAAKLQAYFSKKGDVIKRNLDSEAAAKYIGVLKNAGAICQIVAAEPASPPRTQQTPTAKGPPVLSYQLGAIELAYAPVETSRMTACDGGLNFSRADMLAVPFSDIVLLSVFCQKSSKNSKILFYLRGKPRPFISDCNKIAYVEFPGVRGESMGVSLRNFVKFLFSKNSAIALDPDTCAFMNGKDPLRFDREVALLTTALGKALKENPPAAPPPVIKAARPDVPPSKAVPETVPKPAVPKPAAPAPAPKPDVPASKPLAICPKCGRAIETGRADCNGCGLVFAKWQQHQQYLAEKAEAERLEKSEATPETDSLKELDEWTRRGALIFGCMLIAGFLMPLFKFSIMFGSSVFVWPWQIMGSGADTVKEVAAMATLSDGGHMVVWGLLPLAAGAFALGSRWFASLMMRAAGMSAAGVLMLILLMAVLIDEAEIMGLMFVPPTRAGGVMMLIVIVSGVLVAVSNHLRKVFEESGLLRVLSGAGGILLVAAMVLNLFAARGGWRGGSMIILYLGMILYGGLGVVSAFRPSPGDSLPHLMSFIVRSVLWWAPFACLIAQRWSAGDFVDYVIGGGGGIINIAFSVLKCFLIYYGSAFLMAMGLAALLELMLKRKMGINPE